MIEHVYRRAAAARNVDAVIVATDDERIADAVRKFGGDVRLTRSTHATGTDRIAEVAATLDCDLIVNLQGDEPLIEPGTIDEAIEPFRDDADLVMTSLCHRFQRLGRRPRPACRQSRDRPAWLRALFLALAHSLLSKHARRTTRLRAPINISGCTSSGVNFF